MKPFERCLEQTVHSRNAEGRAQLLVVCRFPFMSMTTASQRRLYDVWQTFAVDVFMGGHIGRLCGYLHNTRVKGGLAATACACRYGLILKERGCP
jgi:hypothetical protein